MTTTICNPHFNKSGNIKVGRIWTWSTLMGNINWYIEKLGCSVCGTCGNHCQGCMSACYVRKSYRYSSVKYGHARNTLSLRLYPQETLEKLDGFIVRAKNKPDVIRINQSGEIESLAQFRIWKELASRHPEIKFYLYTKAFDIVIDELLTEDTPSNLTVLISIWHESGITEFRAVEHLKNVKAFVYDDGFDYSAFGLEIQTYCKAYGENGKLNKEITCQKCKKCFNRSASHKVIGCLEH